MRHGLATREQKEGESIVDCVQQLKLLDKECHFKEVSAALNRVNGVKDTFICVLSSHTMRQRLLEII